MERSFSLMKLNCTRLKNRLLCDTLSYCMRISKFWSLTEGDYKSILKKWLEAENPDSKERRFTQCMQLTI